MAQDLKNWADQVFGPDRFDRGSLAQPNHATLLRLTEMFENAAVLLGPYSDDSLNQAFWDLSSSAFPALRDNRIDWGTRQRLIRSFEKLFRDLFAVRCRPVLGHRGDDGSPLNAACYMWWDFDCWTAAPDPLPRNPLDAAFLESMRSILQIDHTACRESALHGLGHWHHAHGAEVERIIDEFLSRERHLSKHLAEYAGWARCGCVQ